jgi:hypothetical protein
MLPPVCQTGREPAAHHVIGHGDDRDGRSRALRRANGGVAESDNEIDVLRDKFASQRRRALSDPLGPKEQEAKVSRTSLRLGRNTPTTGRRLCCVRAASGHVAAPPSSVMKSRRFTARTLPCF